MAFELEHLMDVYKITEWRDGCVFKTEKLGEQWISDSKINRNKTQETNLLYIPLSNSRVEQLIRGGHSNIRKVTNKEPDYIHPFVD